MSCQCLTAKRVPCKNKHIKDSPYCSVHQDCSQPLKSSKPLKSPRQKSPTKKEQGATDENFNLLQTIARKRDIKTLKKGTLTVSAYANFFPVCYTEKGVIKGLDVEIMEEFSKFCNLKLVITPVDSFDGIWDHPAKRISDTSIGGIGISKERTMKETIWTIPYFKVQRTIVYNKKNPIRKFPNDVSSTVRGTVGSTGYIDGLLRLKKAGKGKLLKPGKTDEQDIQDLKDGKVQGLMRGSFVGKALVKKYKDFDMVKPWEIDASLVSSDGEVFAYPCSRGSDLAIILSEFLTLMIYTGKVHVLLEKYDLL